jgi:phenylacetate-CoA ligase
MDNGLKVNRHHNLQAIITSSETLYPFQRQQIGEAFEVPVFDHYGNTEQAGRFGQCKCLDGHHEFSEHSVIETLNEDSSGGGEIVATALTNYAMPLIRYRTGDAIRRSDKICKCGRGLPLVVSLEGRKQDVALLKDGTPVSLTGFFFAVHVPEMSRLRKIQFQQEEPGHLRAMVVKGELYQEGACEAMLERMNRNLAKPFQMEIQYVDEIPTTRAGKHQFFVSRIRS